jgi:hypothetical protein
MKTGILLAYFLPVHFLTGPTGPPPALPPPHFMSMKGVPLSCFYKPNFEEDGLEFFVCNGGGQGEEMNHREKFKPASTAGWKRYDSYLNK